MATLEFGGTLGLSLEMRRVVGELLELKQGC